MRRSVLFAALIAAALGGSHSHQTHAQGYDGLISSGSGATAPQANEGGGGYDGLLAPSKPPRGAPTQPPGYEGLMPGQVPQRPVETSTPNDAVTPTPVRPTVAATPRQPAYTPAPAAQMSMRPGYVGGRKVMSMEQLQQLAALSGIRIDPENPPQMFERNMKVSNRVSSMTSSPRTRIDGMLPMEMMVKTQIDMIMSNLNRPNQTDEQRRTVAQNGYNHLMMLADGIITQGSVPDSIYQKMGVSTVFVQEQKEGGQKAMARLQEAFKALRPLQQ